MALAQRLIRKGILSEDDLPRLAEAQAAAPDRPVHALLIERGFAKESDVLAALAEEFGMELVDLAQVKVEPETLKAMPLRLVHRRGLMPLSRVNGTLRVATGDPFDVNALDELQTLTGLHVEPVLASPREIARLIKMHFGVGGETVTALVQERDAVEGIELLEELETDDSELAKMAQEASVVKLVNEILVEAANERASDIHIEPAENHLEIRYRVDGLLQTQNLPPEINRFQAAIISRIKIMSRLNIAEKRLPQDGRIKMRVQADQPAARHRLGHRPDRLRQVNDPLLRAQ
jgi:general secretion pathway protein E/type IV pilus assembly protein PilB